MTYVAHEASGFPANRVMGMAGVLDTARFRAFIAMALDVSCQRYSGTLARWTWGYDGTSSTLYNCRRIPLTELLPADQIEEIVARTKSGGGEIVKLMGTSAWYAPGAAAAQMVEAIVKNSAECFPALRALRGSMVFLICLLACPCVLVIRASRK